MKVKEFVNELKYYQMFLGEIISNYYINESICDFAEQNRTAFNQYGNCLGQISSALVHNQHVLSDILFHKDNDSKSIPRTLGRLFTESFNAPKETAQAIKEKATIILDIIEKASGDIKNLTAFRNNVYAHFNNSLFIEEWQEEYKRHHPFDFEKIIDICKQCIDIFSEMLALLGDEGYLRSVVRLAHIGRFIQKLS